MSAHSRRKGAAFERLVANLLTESTGLKWRRRVRNLEGESDIVADGYAFGHIVVECKHADVLCLPQWWRQALSQAKQQQPFIRPVELGGPGLGVRAIPILVYRQTGCPVRVQLDAHDINADTWPAAGRYTVTLEWDPFAQWLRDQLSTRERV